MSQRRLRSLLAIVAGTLAIVATASAGTGGDTWTFSQLSGWTSNTPVAPNWTAGTDSQTFTQGADSLTAWAVGGSSPSSWAVSSGKGSGSGPCLVQSRPCLYDKLTTGDSSETGLGLTPDLVNGGTNDYEIYNYNNTSYGIGITSSASTGYVTSLTLGSVHTNTKNSATVGESWALDGCTGSFSGCTTLDSGVGTFSGSAGSSTNPGPLTLTTHADGSMTIDLTPAIEQTYSSYVLYVPCGNASWMSGTTCSTLTNTMPTNASNNFLLLSATTMPAPVPEPPNWLLLIVGTGLVGLIHRRRQRPGFSRREARAF